ncbi:MAG: N-acetylmuramoyl-L-alanine amidase [Bacteroidia bacterium]|nr:N-acetylmuramoyl-L-alanine amidase [Bacteroidia bacterium]
MIKKILLTSAFVLYILLSFANGLPKEDYPLTNPYKVIFVNNYATYKATIPLGILEAVAFSQTHFTHLTHSSSTSSSCINIPNSYGVMGLIADGKSYFRNNLSLIAVLSGISESEIINSPAKNIEAYAAAYNSLAVQNNVNANSPIKSHIDILIALSELPLNSDIQNDFALNAHLYNILNFINNYANYSTLFAAKPNAVNLHDVFGDNYTLLSSSKVTIDHEKIYTNNTNYRFSNINQNNTAYSIDYGPALWNPTTCNKSSRNGTAITALAIHTVQGSYAGCISWFKNCTANASAHYVIRSSDGQVTQMVLESVKAFHIGSENPYTIGIEHEGYVTQASYYTTAMYNSSADLSIDICTSNSIDPLKTYYGAGCTGSTAQCGLGACTKVKGHQMFPSQTHNDPGVNWNWFKFYNLINKTYTPTIVNTATGSITDGGGASNNYSDDERKLIKIAPSGATNVTLTFTQFGLENGYDYLIIYDGGTLTSPVIGKYTGTSSPGTVTSSGGTMLVEYRTDCAITDVGFVASYTSSGSIVNSSDVIPPVTTVVLNDNWVAANFTANYIDTDNVVVEKSYYQVSDFNGTEWRSNNAKGFYNDNFDGSTINAEWTKKVGTWTITGNVLEQTDQSLPNTNIYTPLTQNLSNRYLYHWSGNMSGTGTNRRSGFHYFVDSPDSTNRGNSYFIWFRLDDKKIQIYKTQNNVFGAPVLDSTYNFTANTWYDFKVIYDRITGRHIVYINNVPACDYTDPTPLTNGQYISWRSGNCNYKINNLRVYRSRFSSTPISVGPATTNMIRYQNASPTTPAGRIRSIANDAVGNISAVDLQDVNVDWTAPLAATVEDGLGADIDTTFDNGKLSFNFPTLTDVNSGIINYSYAIGTTPGGSDVYTWTDSISGAPKTITGISTVNNTIYYASVIGTNAAGTPSVINTSDGQLYLEPTKLNSIIVSNQKVIVWPNPINKNEKINVSIKSLANEKATIEIINELGQLIKTISTPLLIGENNLSLDNGFTQGNYTLKINTKDNILIQKIIIL